MANNDYIHFIVNIKRQTGIDLAQYNEEQLKPRLITGYEKRGFKSFAHYFQNIITDDSLYNEFLDHMTINVTEFFRNPTQWEVLQKRIIPRLIEEKGTISSWSAGCSTGEEPYSLAMIYQEMDFHKPEILASDLVNNLLVQAHTGTYHQHSLKNVPTAFIDKYFTSNYLTSELTESIKKSVRFKKQNLLAEAFTTEFDLILCRNVMIHFTEEAKRPVYFKLSEALRAGGILFIGSCEQIFQPDQYHFEMVAPSFYMKL